METFFIYLLKSSGVIVLFLACYKLFLSRETFHTSTRYFLISGLLLALILPLINYTKIEWIEIASLDVHLRESIGSEASEIAPEIEISSILFIIYLTGLLFGTIRLLLQFLSLSKVFRNSRIAQTRKFKILESNKPLKPFSFFKSIIYHPGSHSEEDLKAILAHEKIHARQQHSVDILAIHLFAIFQWCNPFIHLYKFYLKENLEFIADANTISTEIQKEKYQFLLVKSNLGEKHYAFVNPFFNSSIKKRIVMLNKKKSKKSNTIKYASVVPLLVVFVLLFNVETVAKIRTISPSVISANQNQELADPKVYSISKETLDLGIEALKLKIKRENGELIIENLKRNSEGQIIAATVNLKVSEYGQVTKKFNGKNGIKPIFFGQNDRGGHSFMRDKKDIAKLKSDTTRKSPKINFDSADVYSIHKKTSDKELKQIKSTMEKKGGEFSYTLKRNSNGEIIDLELEIVNGGTGRFKSEPPFERCYFGSFPDGGIFVADDEKSFNQLKERNAKDGKDQKGLGYNIKEMKSDKFNEVTYDKDKTGDFPKKLSFFNYRKRKSPLTKLNYKPNTYPRTLYLVNGVETSYHTAHSIGPENTESINFFRGQHAVLIYGERARNGVLDIRTKNSLYPNPGKLKIPDLISVGSEESSNSLWKASARLAPKNQDKMSASELLNYYQKQNPADVQQDLEEPLIIVDGKEMSKKKFDKIPANEIESMSVLKGEAATKKYKEKGKNGVIEITLKKKDIIIGGAGRARLIIIDGKESSNVEMQNLDQDKIKSISILKDQQAIKKYGKKGKDGVVEIIIKKK